MTFYNKKHKYYSYDVDGTKIRQARQEAKLSQEELARQMGYEVEKVVEIERHNHVVMPDDDIKKFEKIVGKSPDWLIWSESEWFQHLEEQRRKEASE